MRARVRACVLYVCVCCVRVYVRVCCVCVVCVCCVCVFVYLVCFKMVTRKLFQHAHAIVCLSVIISDVSHRMTTAS